MMTIHVYSRKSANFASKTKKPMIYIENKRKSLETIREKYPNAMIIDVTSKAQDEFVKFSPFYPIGGWKTSSRSWSPPSVSFRRTSLWCCSTTTPIPM